MEQKRIPGLGIKVLTDPDTGQTMTRTAENVYEFSEPGFVPATIDLDEYTESERREALESYGYNFDTPESETYVDDLDGEDWRQVTAEIFFESEAEMDDDFVNDMIDAEKEEE
jgi:hypothetical protein